MSIPTVTLGSTGITTPQNGFGALPIQRCDTETAVRILQTAYEGGFTFFDTARAYSDSEIKVGLALSSVRDRFALATKTAATTPDDLKRDLETSLRNLKTDHVDIYQLHCVQQCYRPDDGTGLYETLLDLKRQGVIRHIGITTHKIGVAEEIVGSGLYETLQYPLSYLSSEREEELARTCAARNMGFIAMKGLAGGLLRNPDACFAYFSQFENTVPIWGVQRESELQDWLRYMRDPVSLTPELSAFIDSDRKSFDGDFCRGCGYCMPCTQGITINQCARISLMLRRAPSAGWLDDHWQAEMKKAETCIECGKCLPRCPYGLNIPALLKKNCEDYRAVLRGEKTVAYQK